MAGDIVTDMKNQFSISINLINLRIFIDGFNFVYLQIFSLLLLIRRTQDGLNQLWSEMMMKVPVDMIPWIYIHASELV